MDVVEARRGGQPAAATMATRHPSEIQPLGLKVQPVGTAQPPEVGAGKANHRPPEASRGRNSMKRPPTSPDPITKHGSPRTVTAEIASGSPAGREPGIPAEGRGGQRVVQAL